MFTGEAILKLFAFRLVRRSPFANSAAKRTGHERKIQDPITQGFPVAYINQLRDGPLENLLGGGGGGRAPDKKKIRAREN